MSDREHTRTLSLVFIGYFNPKIFSPDWLLRKGIVSEEQVESAKLEFMHPDVTRFSIQDCTYDIISNRFLAKTSHVHLFEKMRDQVYKIFEILQETPIIQVGINWSRTYQFLESEERLYVEFGHRHLPKNDFWEKISTNPAVLNMSITSNRPDKYIGSINTSIKAALDQPRTIELSVNDHYELRPEGFEKKPEGKIVYSAKQPLEILSTNFDASRDLSNSILDNVYEYGTSTK